MNDPRIVRLTDLASQGRLNRRQLVETGLRLGLATPAIAALVAAAPVSVAAAPAPSPLRRQDAASGTFTVLISDGTDDIDPHYSYTTLSSTIALATYEMLIQYKGESTDEYESMLAESWEGNADGSEYTFKLFPNVTFHDGTACDAQAVKDSYTRWLELDGAPVQVLSRFVSDPEQMEVVDPTTIRFKLGRPQPLFLPAMASQYGPSVVSPAAVEENKTDDDPYAHEWAKANAVGSGPYKLVENSLSEQIVLEKFDDYHRGWEGNHFDKVVFRVVPENATRRQLLEQGDADASAFNLTPDDVEALKKNENVDVAEYDSTNVTWTIMNAPRLKTKEARQGFSYAFPYDNVVDGAYKGLIKRSGPIPDNVRGYDPKVFLYQTDLEKAKQLILSAGHKEGDSFDFMFDSNSEIETTIAQLFQANVQEMGFDLELGGVDYSTLESTILGDAPPEEKPVFMNWGWWPDYNDPWNHLNPNFLKAAIGGGGSNAGAWVNDRFEAIMAEAEQYTDEAELATLMAEAQKILTELDPPAIYQGQLRWYTILGKDITGFVANGLYLGAFPFYSMSRQSS